MQYARSHQQLEVPLVTARRVQHDLHEARCGCGALHLADRPAGVPASAVSIGPTPSIVAGSSRAVTPLSPCARTTS